MREAENKRGQRRLPGPRNVSTYDPEIARKMCEQLAEGIPLREICRQEGMPAWRTVYDWMTQDDRRGAEGAGLSAAIAHARDIGCDAIAEDCLRIADTPLLGEEVTESEDEEGVKRITIKRIDMLGHRKLQVETRLKLIAKFNPKKYGERAILAGDADNPIKVEQDFGVFKDLLAGLQTTRHKEV